ncbi:hypothetical protein [Corynebacterium stationis]|jgi:hypothetical protein|uniref:hypothetical protein n=1 Tax=Corynebacterium stationis TaxID=1705 RepID=UPI0026041CD6|nr:hypothetical protein [Corynebacterium stationis]
MSENLFQTETLATECFADREFKSEEAITFFVGWQSGKSYNLRQVGLHKSIASNFLEIANQTAQNLVIREEETWSPEADLTPETYLVCDIDSVGDEPKITHQPNDLFLPTLLNAELLERVSAKDIPNRSLALYGFTIGEGEDRTVFIRKSNPRRGLGRGKFFGVYNDIIRRELDPVLAFDDLIDLVVVRDKLIVLSQTAFAMFFRDNNALVQLVPKWSQVISQHVPFGGDSLNLIEERAQRDSRQRQRLESIATRGHLKGQTISDFETAMKECGLDPLKYIQGDQIIVQQDDVPQILYFLNEDLFAGSISKTNFRVDKKAAR